MARPGADYVSHFGGRVLNELQGKGIGQLGQRFSMKYLGKLYPKIDRMVSSRQGLPQDIAGSQRGVSNFAGQSVHPQPQRLLVGVFNNETSILDFG